MEKKVIVCLGRQFGSGGRQLGQRLAEILGIAYYDRELMEEMAKHSGLDVGYLEERDEQIPGFFDYALVGRYGTTRMFGSGQNFVMLSETLKRIASERSCLIVGRTADYILRDEPNIVKVFVHAPYKYRVRRVAKGMNISVEQADSLIQKNDKDRARFYDFFTDKTWGQADSYDLSVDISKLGEEEAAQFIADYVGKRMERFY